MTKQLVDAELAVFKPTNDTDVADATIPSSDLNSVSINSRVQNLVDTGSVKLDNDRGAYSGVVTSGDRLEFRTRIEGEDALSRRWTGLVRPVTYDKTGPASGTLDLRVDDFVFGLLDIRSVVNAFEGKPISGNADAILNRILANNAPEVDRSQIVDVGESVNVVWNATSLLEAVSELADRGDAVASADDTSLVFRPISDIPVEFALQSSDKGLHTVKENDDSMANQVRVEGGTGVQVDEEQTTQDGWTTVSDSNRVTVQLGTRKSEVTRLELWTDPTRTGSGDNLVARLQADDGGAPAAVNSTESDIARKELSADFLAQDDWTTFLMPDHTLPDPNPWLILESAGSAGQAVGVDSSTTVPAYRAYYPYPLATILEDTGSIAEYRRREKTIRKETLKTRQQTNEVAKASLRHSAMPERTIEFPAESVRAHNLDPGEVIFVDEPDENFVGNAVVLEKRDRYDGVHLSTTIVAQEVASV